MGFLAEMQKKYIADCAKIEASSLITLAPSKYKKTGVMKKGDDIIGVVLKKVSNQPLRIHPDEISEVEHNTFGDDEPAILEGENFTKENFIKYEYFLITMRNGSQKYADYALNKNKIDDICG